MKYEWIDYRESRYEGHLPHIDLIDPTTKFKDAIVQIFKTPTTERWGIHIKGFNKDHPYAWIDIYDSLTPPKDPNWDDLKIIAEEALGISRKLFTGDISFEI